MYRYKFRCIYTSMFVLSRFYILKESIEMKREGKILLYFIVVVLLYILGLIYITASSHDFNFSEIGTADVDGDGIVGDVEGYSFFLKELPKAIFVNFVDGFFYFIFFMVFCVHMIFKLICIILQIISVTVKKPKAKKILTWISVIMNFIVNSLFLVAYFSFGFTGIGIVSSIDIVGLAYIIIMNRNKNKKIDLYDLEN